LLIRNQQVAGSIPAGGSSLKSISQRVARWGPFDFCQQIVQFALASLFSYGDGMTIQI
jgi:hypothetical protein